MWREVVAGIRSVQCSQRREQKGGDECEFHFQLVARVQFSLCSHEIGIGCFTKLGPLI